MSFQSSEAGVIGITVSDSSLHQPVKRGHDIRPEFWRRFERERWNEVSITVRPRRGEVYVVDITGQGQWINIMEPGVKPNAMMALYGNRICEAV